MLARGLLSTVPDNPGAVDAEILCRGRVVGELTLIPGDDGDLHTWGSDLHWADDELLRHLDGAGGDGARYDVIGEIVDAVRAAARGSRDALSNLSR